MKIVPAEVSDALALSALIRAALWHTNLRDYGEEAIRRVEAGFTPEMMVRQIESFPTFLCRETAPAADPAGPILGTGGYHQGAVRAMFVHPGARRRGVARALLARIEVEIRGEGRDRLFARASIAGRPFYAAMGFTALHDLWEGDERTIMMVKLVRP